MCRPAAAFLSILVDVATVFGDFCSENPIIHCYFPASAHGYDLTQELYRRRSSILSGSLMLSQDKRNLDDYQERLNKASRILEEVKQQRQLLKEQSELLQSQMEATEVQYQLMKKQLTELKGDE